jgi:hypothetical protein
MSSALTGNQIKDSYQALLKIGTNGSLDPTTPITISDGLGNDTPLQVSGNRFNTQYLASNIGLDLNFSGNAYTIGDYDFTSTTTSLKVNVNGQQIITNSNGGYRGFNLDFFNDSYQFGDINGVTNANLFVIDNASSIIKTMKSGNDIGLKLDFANNVFQFGNFNERELNLMPFFNIVLGDKVGVYTLDYINGAVYNNTIIGNFDWNLGQGDISKYALYNNCFINDTSNVDVKSVAFNNNLFVNNESSLANGLNISLSSDENISNCFILGANDFFGSNNFKFFSNIFETKTNVIVLNTTASFIDSDVNNIFTLNSSEYSINKYCSGISIFGGDYFSSHNGSFVTAQHITANDGITGVNVFGQKAKLLNNFTNVFGYYSENSATSQGQVQIEQKQLYRYYSDPDVTANLLDTFDDYRIYIPQGSSYLVEVKIISYIGENDFSTGGNWFKYDTFMVSNDNVSNVVRVSTIKHVTSHNVSQVAVNYFDDTDSFGISVHPHIGGSSPCWVKAEVVINKISVV